MSDQKKPGITKKVFAAGLGNVLEWYDFGCYGFFAVIIGNQFFPSDDPFTSLLAAFGAFAAGYLARPIGAVVLGHIGDRLGRMRALTLVISVMGGATIAIGLLPGYATIGVAAPILLVALRVLQGFAVAGEYSTSTVFLIEHAPPNRRAYVSSWSTFGQFSGLILGSGVGALVSTILGQEAVNDWGWRVPFILSIIITALGFYYRRGMADAPIQEEAEGAEARSPVVVAVKTEWRSMLVYFCMIVMTGVGWFVAYVYAVNDLTAHMHVSTAKALDINTVALFAILVVTPFAGLAADRFGRKPLAIIAAVGTGVLALPLWWLIHHENTGYILIGQLTFAVLFAVGWAVYAVIMVETLAPRVRCTVISIGNGLAYGIFGGLTPLIATYLVERTGNDYAPVYLLIVMAAVSFVAILLVPETLKRVRARRAAA
ncbi:MAG: MFS transporter [Pseudomonadota bacterium]